MKLAAMHQPESRVNLLTWEFQPSGTLILANAFDFSGTVAGFDGNDALVLGDVGGRDRDDFGLRSRHQW